MTPDRRKQLKKIHQRRKANNSMTAPKEQVQLNPEVKVSFDRQGDTITITTIQTFKGEQAEALVSKMITDIDQYEANIANQAKQRDGVKEFLKKVTTEPAPVIAGAATPAAENTITFPSVDGTAPTA